VNPCRPATSEGLSVEQERMMKGGRLKEGGQVLLEVSVMTVSKKD
jgi:hypothetical protein